MQEKEFLITYFLSYLVGESAQADFQMLDPYKNQNELQEEFLHCEEALQFLCLVTSPSFIELPDTREALRHCVKGLIPSLGEVFAVYKSLCQWNELSLIKNKDYPFLFTLYNDIPCPPLAKIWMHSFDEKGLITDNASSELKRIRSLKKSLRTRIEKILHSSLNSEDISEKILTFREGRYVLPYKSAAKNRTRGIVHGYSASGLTAYIEPAEIVELNNELLSVDDLEYREIDRLLREWGSILGQHQRELTYLLNRMSYLEILFAKARFAREHKAVFPQITKNQTIKLKQAYNPFLLLKKGRSCTVPVDFQTEENIQGVIISGPNAGGKSAAIKTIALYSELMRLGLPLPALKVELPLYDQVLIEMGDNQSLDNELSTFSAHLTSIKAILAQAKKNTLIIIDEIAHATDPIEGEALASAIIDALLETEAFFIITTHYKKIKTKAFEHSGLKIYATGFDKNFVPSFILLEDAIGESYALKIAERIGLDKKVWENAEKAVIENRDQKEEILANIGVFESRLRTKEQLLTQKEQSFLQETIHFQKEKKEFEQQKQEILDKGLALLDTELNDKLKELSHFHKEIKKDAVKASEILAETKKIVDQRKKQKVSILRKKPKILSLGQTVYISSLGKNAVIEDIYTHGVSVRAGVFKLTIDKSELFETDTPLEKADFHIKHRVAAVQNIDLRGKLASDALKDLEKALHAALATGYDEVSIIHGKGTGALQKVVHTFLKEMPEVSEYKFALPQDGGSGKTIVKFS